MYSFEKKKNEDDKGYEKKKNDEKRQRKKNREKKDGIQAENRNISLIRLITAYLSIRMEYHRSTDENNRVLFGCARIFGEERPY